MKTNSHIKLIQTIMIWMLFGFEAIAQSGTLKGTVTEEKTNQPIPFANIIVESGGKSYGAASTDFDGSYSIKPIPAGKYDVKAQILGYKPVVIKDVVMNADKITFLNIKMTPTSVMLNVMEVRDYKVPLIYKDQTTSGETVSSQDISKMPGRSSHAAAVSMGGIYSQSGSMGSVRGNSNNGTITYIDGVRVRGSSTLPNIAIEELTIYLGGLPAAYESTNKYSQGPYSYFPQCRYYSYFSSNNYSDYNTEAYDKIVENEFDKVSETPLSTFSIDVDVASYGNMRRYISQGVKPPADAIRAEELINYFDYNYPAPTNDEAFAIYTEVASCPWNRKHQLVHIGIQGKKMNMDHLPQSNLVFLIDVSGSMDEENKLPLVKKSMRLLVNQLQAEDKIALVVYASSSGLVLNSTSCKRKDIILDALDNLQAGGSTAGGEGLQLAFQIAKENYIENGNNRVIIATDGDFNVGPSSDADIENLIIEKRKDGIFLSVLGYGMGNYKDSKMEKLADKGNGNYAYIDNILEAKKVLVKEMGATLYTIAKDVKIQIEFNPRNVKAYRLIGYEDRILADKDFSDDSKDAGELGAGSTVTALYEIITSEKELKAIPAVDSLKYQKNTMLDNPATLKELLTVKVRYKKPKEAKSQLCQEVVNSSVLDYALASDNFKFSAAVASFSMLLRDSKYIGKTSYSDIIRLSKQGKGSDDEGYRSEFIKLVEMAELIK